MKTRKKRSGKRKWQAYGTMMFLALGLFGATSFFLFFLGTRESRAIQQISQKIDMISANIDNVIDELENCASLEVPMEGGADHCFFRRATGVGNLGPSVDLEGFLFSEGNLMHVVRKADGEREATPFRGSANPLVTGVKSCEFRRVGPRLLRVRLEIAMTGEAQREATIVRSVFLKNH